MSRRRDLRAVNKKAAQSERTAQQKAGREEAKYRQDIRALETEIAGLVRPGLGRLVKEPVGDMSRPR
ncbi:hypothetical protein ABZ456_28300 [Streptomyces sp. NPDC005776]|uniref:hypothetical protein n=1 Tax=Streptomyces sp. NPDC005776 TaxID=3154676 RepID=UPI0033FAE903